MERHGPDQADQTPGHPHGPSRLQGGCALLAQDLESQQSQVGRGRLDVAFERRQVFRRRRYEVGFAGVDQPVEAGAGQAGARHRPVQRLDHGVAARAAVVDAVQALAPPLETDPAEHVLAHNLGGLGDLEVEGVEREEILAPLRRRQQARQVAVAVVAPDLEGAVGKRIGGGHECCVTPP